jgi:hypothetical protein
MVKNEVQARQGLAATAPDHISSDLRVEHSVDASMGNVSYGTGGSMRFDAYLYDANTKVVTIFDHKIGNAELVQKRIQQIVDRVMALGSEVQRVVVVQIKP